MKNTEFLKKRSNASEMCHHLEGIFRLCNLMKNLMAAERTSNWTGHLAFGECDNLNNLRYGSLYLEKMQMPETGYPYIHKEFGKEYIVVQEYSGCFTTTSPDLRLKQIIQQSRCERSSWTN